MLVVGLDTETTGLEPEKGHKIIELCLHVEDFATGKIVGVKTWRIQPNRRIDPKAEAVHKISLDMLEGCPTFDVIAPTVHKLLGKADLLIAHNALFDIDFLATEFDSCGLVIPDRPYFCTMENARWACPDGKMPKLGELCYAMGIDYDGTAAHAADYDVGVMMKAFRKGVELGYFKLPEREEA